MHHLVKTHSPGLRRWLLAAILLGLCAAEVATADESQPRTGSDEAAIRACVDSYVSAYNRADAKAVAAHWSDSGEWISPAGTRFRGRDAIEKELRSLFAENKGVRIEVENPSIRLVTSDVAIEEGTVRVTTPKALPSESTYVAVHVKKNGQWKLDSVRETDLPETPATGSPLQDLAWLVGTWTDRTPQATVDTSVAWTKNKTFLTYSFKASMPGADDLEGTQVIGWDPAAQTIRSWMFDSDGGFGEGVWTRKDNTWVVKFSQVLPDGSRASATNIYTPVDGNTWKWKSIGRKVDGQFLPNLDEVRMVRAGTEAQVSVPRGPSAPQLPPNVRK